MTSGSANVLAFGDGEAVCRQRLTKPATSEALHAVALERPAAGAGQLVSVLQKALLHGPIIAEILPTKMRSIPAASALLLRRARVLSQGG
jgi:hypothetical protein